MTHYLEYRLGPTDDGKEVLFLMQKVLGFTTKKVRSVKHEEWGILLNGKRVTVRARGKEGQLLKVMLEHLFVSSALFSFSSGRYSTGYFV